MLAWNDEKLMRAYEATKKLERSPLKFYCIAFMMMTKMMMMIHLTTLRSPRRIQPRAIQKTRMYPRTGSSPFDDHDHDCRR